MSARAERVVSLLPSATEIVCAVGARERLVGRSHECDHPPGLDHLPVLTRPRRTLPRKSGEIDRTIREILTDALAVYEVDLDALRRADATVIVTQDLCDVCAVSLGDVECALAEIGAADTRIVSLRPGRLADVWEDVRRVGRALGAADVAECAAAELERRCDAIAERARTLPDRPRTLTIEWLDPVMIGGTWMPELVSLAGGSPLVTKPGELAPTLGVDALAQLDPEVVLIKPCGFDLERTRTELHLLAEKLPWQKWDAVAQGRVFVADGNAYFNRPGPRLVESLEILAALTHPGVFADFTRKHADAFRRVSPNLEMETVRA